MFSKHLFLAILFVTATVLCAEWFSIDRSAKEGTNPQIEVIVSTEEGITLEISLPGFFREKTQGQWQIEIPENTTLEEIGKSALPVISELIAVPANVQNVKVSNFQSLHSQELENFSVYPFQKPTKEDEVGVFSVNTEHYRSGDVYPAQQTNLEEVAIWRNQKVLPFRFSPMQIVPAANKLIVHTKVRVTLKYEMGATNLTKVAASPVFETMYRKSLVNYTPRNTVQANGQYLIIAADGLYEAAQPLIGWKKGKGNQVSSVKLSSVGTTTQNIKDYIRQQYTRGVSYVLLIGDPEELPLYKWSAYGDYWYSCVAGDDLYPDVAVGRICAKTPQEVNHYIQKIQAYAQGGDWATKSLLVSHKENAPGKYHGCIEEVLAAKYKNKVNFTVRHGNNSKNTNDTIIDDINSGFGIVTYRGHGSRTAWTGWNGTYFNNRHAYKLANSVYPVVFSICCTNSELNKSETLAEAFMNYPAGASAFLGATEPSYTVPNHDFCKNLFLGAFQEEITAVGDLSNFANVQLIKKYGQNSYAMNNVKMYLWLGDPGMKLHVGK